MGPGMPFLDSHTRAEGVGYLFLPVFSSLYDAIQGTYVHIWVSKTKNRLVGYVEPGVYPDQYPTWEAPRPNPRSVILEMPPPLGFTLVRFD